ncbi:hypothetical protein Pcinc_034968 [Petrolisthes cinctipes]|uniref:Uncharacterized protein n=1 Tax=Petrolisthes cinctipes TaxID=88211 RepID=A0AAE1BZ99_PETCI|nr:hypothetical protein Pcinc_034968 [Petrolisthes cinctipes]
MDSGLRDTKRNRQHSSRVWREGYVGQFSGYGKLTTRKQCVMDEWYKFRVNGWIQDTDGIQSEEWDTGINWHSGKHPPDDTQDKRKPPTRMTG